MPTRTSTWPGTIGCGAAIATQCSDSHTSCDGAMRSPAKCTPPPASALRHWACRVLSTSAAATSDGDERAERSMLPSIQGRFAASRSGSLALFVFFIYAARGVDGPPAPPSWMPHRVLPTPRSPAALE